MKDINDWCDWIYANSVPEVAAEFMDKDRRLEAWQEYYQANFAVLGGHCPTARQQERIDEAVQTLLELGEI